MDEWIASLPPIPKYDVTAVMNAAGYGNRPRNRGIPDYVPSLAVNSSNRWSNRDAFLRAAERAYESGYSEALLLAFRWCSTLERDRPLPVWILCAFQLAIDRWRSGVAGSLDESLGLSKPYKAKIHHDLRGMIVVEIHGARAAGVPIGEELFESMGLRWGAKKSTISSIYYASTRKLPKNSA